ncbi:MAG TPA: hypothetical protein VM864_01475 [Pyrinomonadaceae bacterium]|jgi:hypothetical protein|nr:hypothetical protein [Pyrinomonadaceae bacterium]
MKLFEGKSPAERNKLLAALLLPLVALLLILRMFFASDAPKTTRGARPGGKAASGKLGTPTAPASGAATDVADGNVIDMPSEVPPVIGASYAPDAARNIFAYYVKPTPVPTSAVPQETPTPTPTPPPPLTVASLQPVNVYARGAEFTLEVVGDKFTPQTRVYVEGQEQPTTFKSPQQLSAKIPAALIQSPGARAVVVRTPDNALYSNVASVNVMPAPTPQYTFIGIFGTKRYVDKAILKPTVGNDLLTVQRGDIVGGRFKVTSISERTVDLVDTQLSIKHSIPYSDAKGATGGAAPRFPQPPATDDDDEP